MLGLTSNPDESPGGETGDAIDSKSIEGNLMWVRFPPRAHRKPPHILGNEKVLAYLIGVGIGDGNLSLLNNRSIRLRISCDTKYPNLIQKIVTSINTILPENKINLVKNRGKCVDIVSFSNFWEPWLGWRAEGGSKSKQNVRIPSWIFENSNFLRACLRGLIETDGSVYVDRGYTMVNFTTIIPGLAQDVFQMIVRLGFRPRMYKMQEPKSMKYVIRICKDSQKFISQLEIDKS